MPSLSALLEQRRRWRERKNYLTKKHSAAKARQAWSKDPFARADAERAATDLELTIQKCQSRIRAYDAIIADHPQRESFRPRKLNQGPSRPQKRGVL